MHRWIVAFLVACFIGCGSEEHQPATPNVQSSLSDEPATDIAIPRHQFEQLTAKHTGVEIEHRIEPDHPERRLYHSGFVCGGVAIGDIDADGLPDLYFSSGPKANRLYRNLGDCRFEDITATAGVGAESRWSTGTVMVDIDNDHDLDIYVCNYDAPNLLYINNGRGQFVEEARKWNLDIVDACLTATFHDYDRDGDLDVYLLNNRYYRKGGRPRRPPIDIRGDVPVMKPEYEKFYTISQKSSGSFSVDDYGRPDRFLRNNGNSFEDVTAEAGIQGNGFGLSATWWDYDHDGWPDLYVCNDFNAPDRLYRNNGDGTFRDALAEVVPHTPWFSMGSDAGDINNDGLVDFFCVDMSARTHYGQKTTMGAMNAARLAEVAGPPPQYMRNALYLNTGFGRCMEIAYLAGLADTDWSWAAKLADLNHDGHLDVFITNGMVRSFNDSDIPFETSMLIGKSRWDLYRHLPPRPEQNLVFANRGNLTFTDESEAWGLNLVGMSYGAALADLDDDQDLDLVVINVNQPVSIYRNHVPRHDGLTIALRGDESNSYGMGARVELETTSSRQVRYMNPLSGYLGSSQPIVHFGLDGEVPERVIVHWPSGGKQVFAWNKQHHLVISEASSAVDAQGVRPERWFEGSVVDAYRHQEADFDDFKQQPLLPNRLSRLGPATAVSDFDSDGDEDIFAGGPAGQPGTFLVNDGQGNYLARTSPALVADAASEDLGVLFLDIDGDDDEDLYVVSGGVEVGSKGELVDRLYLNEDGQFQRTHDLAPNVSISGSVVAANDFDRDGDLDLFVGGRVVQGQYPLSPGSRLLKNEGGRLVDATQSLAPNLLATGMVSGGLWSDIDSDGWDDLILVGEWHPVRVFHNREGKLVERTESTETDSIMGWFNGISGRDLDGDQDIDFVVSNFGLNTKYHASTDHPALLYYGDFENRGRMRLVEAEYENNTLFPIRGKSCSTHAMPFLSKSFTTYREFATADLQSLYSQDCLDTAHRFSATELQSGVLVNEGNFKFRFQPLPRLAQVAPGFGMVVTEVNGDGYPDIYLVQNFHGPQPETGNMDGGVSLLLIGNREGDFVPAWPQQSGLVVPGDATSVVTTDANGDGAEDFFVGVNQGSPHCFLRRYPEEIPIVRMRLVGPAGNRRGVGSRITLQLKDGTTQTAEVYAGSGYLSQSSSALTFGLGSSQVDQVFIDWPDGNRSQHIGVDGESSYTLRYSD